MIHWLLLSIVLIKFFLIQYLTNSQSNQLSNSAESFCTEQPLPYWTAYGLPEYWPTVLSPYWYYDVPFTGPITGSGGYYSPHTPYILGNQRGWPDPRGPYAPHGPRPGYSGVAMGGF